MCHCGHPKGLHVGVLACRVNGCSCAQFRDSAGPETAPASGGRRVTFEVPDGYALTVSLVPYTEPDPAAIVASEEAS